MNKHREQREKGAALALLAYAMGPLLGEAVRDRLDGEGGEGAGGQDRGRGKRWRLYSGRFVLLKQKIRLGREVILRLANGVIENFRRLAYGLVRS